MIAPAALELTGIRKSYDGGVVLDGFDLAVHPGEIVALLGPNGAGKTTAAEIGLGLRTADAGRVRLLGHAPRRAGRDVRARIGATLERGGLPRPLRVRESMELHAAFWADPRDPDELIERLGLSRVAHAAYRTLSAGERARLALALALVGRPELCVFDEPTAAMDVAARDVTWQLLRELRDGGAAILLTTHLLDEAARLADRVVVLDRGRIVAVGPPGAIGGGRPVATLVLDAPLGDDGLAALRDRGVDVEAAGDGRYRLRGPSADVIVSAVAAAIPALGRHIHWFRVGDDGLEALLRSLGTRADER